MILHIEEMIIKCTSRIEKKSEYPIKPIMEKHCVENWYKMGFFVLSISYILFYAEVIMQKVGTKMKMEIGIKLIRPKGRNPLLQVNHYLYVIC